jgi:GDP-4-dehydro-6-deoxy-D-mannose reductase
VIILVTGSAGFVGSRLMPRLRQHGTRDRHEVIGFDFAAGDDIRDYEQIRHAVEAISPDLIIHLAAQTYVRESVTDTRRAVDVNFIGTVNLLEAVHQVGSTARVLLAGTIEEYGYGHAIIDEDTACTPSTPYGATKLAASAMALSVGAQHGIPVVVTRAVNHTGAGQSSTFAVPAFAKRVAEVKAGKAAVVRHGDLSAWRAFLDVEDVIDAYLRLGFSTVTGVYNIAPAGCMQMSTVLDTLVELASDERPILRQLDPRLGQSNASHPFVIKTDKIRRDVGWEARRPFTETLAEVLKYWEERV